MMMKKDMATQKAAWSGWIQSKVMMRVL